MFGLTRLSYDTKKITKLENDGKSESINYTLLNEKRIHDEKNRFTYLSVLTILLITY